MVGPTPPSPAAEVPAAPRPVAPWAYSEEAPPWGLGLLKALVLANGLLAGLGLLRLATYFCALVVHNPFFRDTPVQMRAELTRIGVSIGLLEFTANLLMLLCTSAFLTRRTAARPMLLCAAAGLVASTAAGFVSVSYQMGWGMPSSQPLGVLTYVVYRLREWLSELAAPLLLLYALTRPLAKHRLFN